MERELTNDVKKFVDVSTETVRMGIGYASTQTVIRNVCASTQTEERGTPQSITQMRQENRVLKQRVKRQSLRIDNLKDLLRSLRQENLLAEDHESFLFSHFQGEKMIAIKWT